MSTPVYNQTPTVQNRPAGRLDCQGRVIPSSFGNMSFRGEYTGSNLTFFGFARPGESTADAVWQIAKLAYGVGNTLISITWPKDANGNASNDYQFVWDDRAMYTYA